MIILDTAGDTIQAEASAASAITVSCYGIETASGTDTYKRLGVAQLTGAATQDTIYTVPASTVTICSVIVIANTSGSARTIKLWDVENGGSPGDANAILGTVTIAANSSIIWNKGNITEIPNAAGSGGAAHAILDGSVHSDSVADAVTRGSIIYGNATPKWDELVVGAADTFLGSDGTDVSYRTAAQVLASLSGEAGAAFSFNSQNLTGVGAIGCGAITGTSTGLFEGASVTVGKASTTTGTLVLHDSNSVNTITLTVPDISAGSLSFTLPPTDGDNTNVLQTDGNGILTWVAAGGGGTGFGRPLVFTPQSNEPPSANFATLDLRNLHPVLDFDATTNESAVFRGVLPTGYAGGGLTVYIHYAMTSAEVNTVDWDVAFERIGDQQLDIDGDSFAAVQSVDNTTVPGTTGLVDVVSIAFTDGAQMDSIAAGESFRVKVTRDAASDDAAGDAELLFVVIKET